MNDFNFIFIQRSFNKVKIKINQIKFIWNLKYKYIQDHSLKGFSAAFPMLSLGLIPIEINSWNNNLHA